MSFKTELIPDEDFVFRQVTPRDREGPNGKRRRFPNETHFQLRKNEEGLSVNWSKYIDVEKNYILIALTKNQEKGTFQNHTAYKIFKYPVSFLRSIEKIEDVIHTPKFNGDPAPIGKPNNQSHSDVVYENDVEIFVKLMDFCEDEYDSAYCNFEVNSINDKIEELKALLNDTPYHRLA
ncbi:hypothetical protein [Abyssalbus ytuae]|uniref:Uncharacterized protein n=1 Tax=Abyssalbus ytuae TaxID=2926907 RepID=A0A9E7A1N1_9FLAO|nr:hypothetical protein [Abyssalbus ytuae]UOB19372.1 hypothetical protein MQE35_08745 [Abyssalbus ytuae]